MFFKTPRLNKFLLPLFLKSQLFMQKLTFLTLLFVLLFCKGFAQTGSLNGTLLNSFNDKPIAGAVVSLLYQRDSAVVKETISNETGAFSFTNLPSDSFLLKISTLTFEPFTSYVNVYNTSKILPAFKLNEMGKNLAAVTVVTKVAAVSQKGDTVQYSANQYKVNKDATTEDLIKKIPGVTVAKDGTVTAQGETVRKVTIDGKDFFGDDASAALKNVQSEMVDKIQIFDRMSDQARLTGFDDGNSVKAINIVTKSGMKNGNLGRFYAGAGTEGTYNVGGNSTFLKNDRRLSVLGSFNNINAQNFASQDLLGATGNNGNNNRGGGPPGGGRGPGGGGGNDFTIAQANGISVTNAIGLNYTNKYNKNMDVSASYFFNNSENTNIARTNTETFLKTDTSLFAKQIGTTLTRNNNHRINARIEYMIDSSNSIFFIPSLNFQNNSVNSFTDINSIFSNRGATNFYDTANTSNSNSSTKRNGYNLRNSLLYRHAFAKKGRSISLGFTNTLVKNNSDVILDADYRFFKPGFPVNDSAQNQLADNFSNGNTNAATIAYTEPLTKKTQLQFDYNPSVQKSKADQQTFGFDGVKFSKFDTLLSNKFDNIITTHNAGVTFRYVPGREELFQVGLSYQTANLKSDRIFPTTTNVRASFSNILPNLIFRKKFTSKSSMRFFYRASINFPSVTQLQDVVNLSNPLRVSSGNASLSQSYSNFAGGRYIYTNAKTNKSFFAGGFFQQANDFVTNATFIPSKDSTIQNGIVINKGTQLTKPVNLDGYRTGRAFVTYSFPIKAIKSVINLNNSINFQRLPGLINSTALVTKSFGYNTGLTVASNISEYIDFNVSYNANFNTAKSKDVSTNFVTQTAGLQLNLLSKSGWFLQNDINYQSITGLTAGFNQNFGLWNAAIGKKFLKKQVGELKLSVFDLLNQNRSINRTIDARFIEDAQSEVLRQYFMLTFTYSLRNFGKATKQATKQDNKEEVNRLLPRTGGGPF
jgi:hypothetical protein